MVRTSSAAGVTRCLPSSPTSTSTRSPSASDPTPHPPPKTAINIGKAAMAAPRRRQQFLINAIDAVYITESVLKWNYHWMKECNQKHKQKYKLLYAKKYSKQYCLWNNAECMRNWRKSLKMRINITEKWKLCNICNNNEDDTHILINETPMKRSDLMTTEAGWFSKTKGCRKGFMIFLCNTVFESISRSLSYILKVDLVQFKTKTHGVNLKFW